MSLYLEIRCEGRTEHDPCESNHAADGDTCWTMTPAKILRAVRELEAAHVDGGWRKVGHDWYCPHCLAAGIHEQEGSQ